MASGKSTWKYNKLLKGRRNYFSGLHGSSMIQRAVAANNPGFAPEIQGLSGVYGTPTTPTTPETTESQKLANLGYTGNNKVDTTQANKVDTTQANIAGGIGSAASVLASQLGSMINNINAGDIEANKKARLASVNNSQLGAQSSDYNFDQLISDYGNLAFINHVTKKDMGAKSGGQIFGEGLIEGLKGSAAGFSAGASFGAEGGPLGGIRSNKYMGGGPIGAIIGGVVGTGTSLIGNLIRNHKAKKAAAEVNAQIDYTNAFNEMSLTNRTDNLINDQMSELLANYSAYGGPLDNWDGAIGYQFATDWLNNRREKVENKGNYDTLSRLNTFDDGGPVMMLQKRIRKVPDEPQPTQQLMRRLNSHTETFNDAFAKARREGLQTFEFNGKLYTTELGDNPDNWEAGQRRKRIGLYLDPEQKALGGNLMTHGADWDTNLMYIGNGGSHESNPFEGVPMGVDQEGTPNLVEEGETIFNDYVFSRRLKVPRGMRGKYKLGGPISFADTSIKLAKEAEERPNDPISQRGLNALMQDLAISQEEVKAKKEQNMFANGGKVNKFWGGGNTLKPYSGVAGYNAGKWMDDNGNYLEDYYTRVGKMDREAWQRHVDDQYKFWKDSNNKNTPRWKAIDNMYKVNPWMKDYKVEDGDIESMATLARSNPGFMHPLDELQRQLDAEAAPVIAKEPKEMHYLRQGQDKAPVPMPASDIYTPYTNNGYSWDERFKDKYTRVNNGVPEINSNGDKIYWYDPVETPATKSFYHFSDDPEFNGDVYSKIGQGYDLDNKVEDETGTHYYYKPKATDEPMEMNKLEKLRGISALNNLGQLAYGLFAKPDYSNADALLEAVNNGQPFQPVGWKPIGDLMQNRVFDVERGINSLNNIFGSTVRAVQQNAGMNRGAGMAGLLAASNQYLNSVGDLRQKALEYNDARYKEALDFNRATNIANSEGFLKADMANQSAMTDARKQNMSARVAAAEMRQGIKNAWDAGVNANLNGLFETAENMAWEAKNDNMLRRLLNKGYVPKDVYRAKGGKLKRVKRGLTF